MNDTTQKMDRREILLAELAAKRQEHRDLDMEIASLQEAAGANAFSLQRLKRMKLAIKDEIARLEDEITPDIIA